jgi:hypothetical protein
MIVVVSISLIFSLSVNALYGMPDHSIGNATTQTLSKYNSTTSNTPSVLRLSPVPSNNGTSSTSEPSTNTKDNTNTLTASNSEPVHTHQGSSVATTGSTTGSTTASSSDHHKDNANSHDLAQKIINKIKQNLKVGDVPFP